MQHAPIWIVTADARNARIYSCRRVAGNGPYLEELSAITNTHEAEHERQRPILGGGAERRGAVARSGAHAAPHAIAPPRTADEETARFAREVSDWLASSRKHRSTGRVILFAPPRFLGLLRKQIAPDAATQILEGDLSQLDARDLAAHPAVRQALGV